MYRPMMRAISIPDLALARQLALRDGLPDQTYIKRLMHDALDCERTAVTRPVSAPETLTRKVFRARTRKHHLRDRRWAESATL